MRIRILLTLSLLFSYYLAAVYAQQTPTNYPGQDELQNWLEEKYLDTVPGIAVGIVKDGEVYFEGYAGMANLEHQVPVADSTCFNIASVAKQFTALCVLQLILDKKLNLDDDLRKFLPDFYAENPNPIEIRHLLAHTSGVRDLYELLSLEGRPWWARVGYDMGDALELLGAQKTLNDTPGTNYRYSNSGYLLLTQVVEQVSGQTFPEYSAALFNRLGMPDTRFQTNYMTVMPNKALPYNDWGDGIWKQYPMVVELYGDGFLYTTLRDQLRFEQLLQVQAGSFGGLLVESQKPIPGSVINSYGFGLELNTWEGMSVVEHEGATGAYGAHTLRIPELDLSVVVMKSNGNYWARALARDLARMFMPGSGEAQKSEAGSNAMAAQGEGASSVRIKESLLSELPARYLLEDGLTFIEITRKDGELYREIEGRDSVRLLPLSKKPVKAKGRGGAALQELAFVYETVPDLKMVFLWEEDRVIGFELRQEGLGPRPAQRLEAPRKNKPIAVRPGTYYNEELEISFQLAYSDNSMILTYEGNTLPLQQKADGLWAGGEYLLRADCDGFEGCSRLLLDTGRMRNIVFSR
ncbi:CubicO group peptidase, beta-lactamase class C family [Robiginitalea myxolifaciens]|uniref:CubicO group peptidase, beta-lactamase class C family n=1 Tax=Robiginitalea myxolifaciens TaxID=400055 RepID=A0A1I6FN65_9FLAO|nr:serine hydrolase domain-containing protein [Robiginitalea myxolifaciens]SFR31304.1 CubicO group peptidase, beta-lactamase class C family [Robiginitalea myxolifaciens]